MNNYDLMVGGGISSLLGNGHSDVAAPGAFDFAQRSEPVVRMADGGMSQDEIDIREAQSTAGTGYGGADPNLVATSNLIQQLNPQQKAMFDEWLRLHPEVSTSNRLFDFVSVAVPAIIAGSLGGTLGAQFLGGTVGTTAGTAIGRGLGSAALAKGYYGASTEDALRAGLLSGATSAIGAGAGEAAGKYAGTAAQNLFTDNPELSSIARNVASGAAKGAVQAIPGAITTRDLGSIGVGALTGGAFGGASGIASSLSSEYGINSNQVAAGINIARAISSGNTNAIINALGPLTGSRDVNIASKAYLALDAIKRGNPIAATGIIMQLGNMLSQSTAKTTPVKTADVGGGPFETSAIFEGTEGGGTSEQDFMGLLGTLGDQAGDYPGQEAGPRMFNAAGQMIAAPSGEFIDLPDGRYIDDRGVIFKPDGTLWSPSGQAVDPYAATGNVIRPGQSVDVSGEPFRSREDIALDYFFYPGEDKPMYDEAGQRIVVTGRPYEEEMGVDLGQIDIVGKPYTDTTDLGKIDIVGKPYVEEPPGVIEGPSTIDIVGKKFTDEGIGTVGGADLTDIINSLKSIPLPKLPETTTPSVTPSIRVPTVTTTPTTRATTQAAAQPMALQNLSALPGDLPLFKSVFYEMERQKELARQAKEIENADKDPYERLMELAEEDPEMAVGKLMQIIEGGQRG